MNRIPRRSAPWAAAILVALFGPLFRAEAVEVEIVSARLEARTTDRSFLGEHDFPSELFYAGPQWFWNALPGSNYLTRSRAVQMLADRSGDRSIIEAEYVGTLPQIFASRFFGGALPFAFYARPFASGSAPGPSAPAQILSNTANIYTGSNGNLEFPGNWSLGHVPNVSEDAVFSNVVNASGNIGTTLTVGSINATGSGQFNIFNPTLGNATLVLGGPGSTGNSVSGNAGDLLYVAPGSGGLGIIGQTGPAAGILTVRLGQTGNFNVIGTANILAAITDGGSGFGINKTGGGSLFLSGANTYTGDTAIKAGVLVLNSPGSLSSSTTIRLGETVTNSPSAQFYFGSSGGGMTVSNSLIVQPSASGTQGARTILGLAMDGNTNTYSGTITMNADLVVQSLASGTSVATSGPGTLLFQGGSIDVGGRTLTVNSNLSANNLDNYVLLGIVRINEVLGSSFPTGGSVVKDGSGTLILQGTSNTYTGLNASGLNNVGGTRIAGGILGIFGDGSLGLAPTVATNNVYFTTSALTQNGDSIAPTLRADADGITLAATRRVNIGSGVTARFDSNGNTFTIAGNINGSGNLNKIGAGTLALTGANTYTGTTTVSAGTLNAAVTNALGGTTGSITVSRGGTLLLSGDGNLNRINDTTPIVLGSATGSGMATFQRGDASNAGTIVSEGLGASRNGATVTGTTSPGLGALSLQSNATFNFGSIGVGTFVFGTFTSNGNSLTITNWTSSATVAGLVSGVDGSNDRLIFTGAPTDVASINFDGTPATFILLDTVLGVDYYEVVPTVIPEPSTWIGAALALAGLGYAHLRGRSHFRVTA